MGTKKAVFYLLAVMLGGCVLPSLHPLYTDEELIFEEKLIGKWSDGNDIWEFREGEGENYQMRVLDGEWKEGQFVAHLVKLGDMFFLDIFPDGVTLGEPQAFYGFHILPVHTFMKVEQIEPKLQLRAMDYDKVSEMLEEDPNLLKHEVVEDRIVLTASTEQLQEFIVEYANEEGVFAEAIELTRREPLYTEEDLIFDERLTGVWEGKDGEILDSIQMGEKAYDMIFTDEDDSIEFQFIANLVKLRDMMFLAIFFDKSSVEDKEPYGLHLIPDLLVLVDQVEPQLRLLPITDYEKLSETLQNDPNLLKQEAEEADLVLELERTCCGPVN